MKPAYGYIIKSDNEKVGFTGDTSLCKTVEYMSKECNYLFCDSMFIEGTDKHMGIDNLKYLSEKYKNCIYVVSHMEDDTRKKLDKLYYIEIKKNKFYWEFGCFMSFLTIDNVNTNNLSIINAANTLLLKTFPSYIGGNFILFVSLLLNNLS